MTKELTSPLPKTWWLRKAAYLRFMIRELTSIAVFAYTLLIVGALWAAGADESYSAFYDFLRSPLSVALHVVILVMALYHTVTWIALTPKVMVLWREDEQVDPSLIAGATGGLFLLVTGLTLWLVLA